MKRIFTILFIILYFGYLSKAQDSLMIQGIKYRVDTLVFRHDVGLGTMHTYYNLPDLPLLVNVVEIDITNPYVDVISCLSNDSTRGLERPTEMAARNTRPEHSVFAAVNGDFYTTSGLDIGLPVNGHLTGGQVAKTPHTSRPVVAFDLSKTPFIDVMTFTGNITRNGQKRTVNGVNSLRGTDQLILYNRYHGRTTKTNEFGTEVICELVNGPWGVNMTMQLKIIEIRQNQGGSPLTENTVVLSGHGASKVFLEALEIGETIELEIKMVLKNESTLPHLMELVGGDRAILVNGVVQDNNWPELHPRTAVGFSADKTTVYLVVVDGRTSFSAGVSTKQLADILKLSGASHAINLDGGGSSVMAVRKKIVNTPSDGTERRVANSLLFVSKAPGGAAVDFKLNATSITVPFGKKFQVKATTYDQYGDVVDYMTAQGVNYHVEGSVGRIDANGLFTASGSEEYGKIIGEWNGIRRTVWVRVKPVSGLKFSISQLTIDHLNTYKFKIFGKDADGKSYLMDNDIIKFDTDNPLIGTVDENGIFKGLSDGVVNVRVYTEDNAFEDFCQVNVEIGKGSMLLDDFSDLTSWTVTHSWLDEVTLSRVAHPVTGDNCLKVAYSMTYANRTAFISLSKNIDIYGMPDSLSLEATGNGYKTSFVLSLDHVSGNNTIPVFTGTNFQIFKTMLRKSEFAQENYPIPFKNLRLTVERDAAYLIGQKYEGVFYLKNIKAIYPEKDYTSSVPQIKEQDFFVVYPNPARHGVYIKTVNNRDQKVIFTLFTLNGFKMYSRQITFESFNQATFVKLDALPDGVYLYEINGMDGIQQGKLVFKGN